MGRRESRGASRRASRRRNEPAWAAAPDSRLLDLRLADLGVTIRGTRLERRIHLLHEELKRRGLRFRPHCWLSEEWFSPDGTPGIAIPFYLAHPRLMQLEQRQMLEIEGGTDEWCLRILRHEAGHAIDTAFRLRRRKRWQQLFGHSTKPYPEYYRPKPNSKRFVLHLGWWYAQSHPTEDFAETFAVWLKRGSRWRHRYQGWPALKKLEYVDDLMKELAGKKPPVADRRQIDPISRNRMTLREHYAEKRKRYAVDYPRVYDRDLRRLFPEETGREKKKSVAALLRRNRADVRNMVARGTGEHPYVIDQLIDEVAVRCRGLGLWFRRPDQQVKMEVAILITVQTVNYLHSGQHRVPL